MIRNWLLIFGSMNTTTDWTGSYPRVWPLIVSWPFLLISEIVSSSIAYIPRYFPVVFVWTEIVIAECYLARHCLVNRSRHWLYESSCGSFDPCHYSQLPLIQFVNKLVTNSETRDTPHKIKHCEICWVKAPIRGRTSFLLRRISSISHCSAADSRTEQVSLTSHFSHLQFTKRAWVCVVVDFLEMKCLVCVWHWQTGWGSGHFWVS